MKNKYMQGTSVGYWIQSNPSLKGGFIIYKCMIKSFLLLENWIAWRIYNENLVRIGIYLVGRL